MKNQETELNVIKLNLCIENRHWDELLGILKPKLFFANGTRRLIDPRILAKVAETLTDVDLHVPDNVIVVLLKCLINSCVDGYLHKEYVTRIDEGELNCQEKLYSRLVDIDLDLSVDDKDPTDKHGYPLLTHFPYDGVAIWAVNNVSRFATDSRGLTDGDGLEILTASIKFLCNLITFACKTLLTPEYEDIPVCTENEDFKDATIKLAGYEDVSVASAASAYVHNALTRLPENYYTTDMKIQLSLTLIKSIGAGIASASDALIFLLKGENRLRTAYKDIPIDIKLQSLDAFRQELREFMNERVDLSPDAIKFLSECFSEKSNLILKTGSSYSNEAEPIEVVILLDILGALTCAGSTGHDVLREDKNLLISCIYLLKSLQAVGKEPNSYFAPIQKLSEVAPGARKVNGTAPPVSCAEPRESTLNEREGEGDGDIDNIDIETHPAFGFKAGLIRVIGNMVYRHKGNQDLLRETEGIPLLLDCCNIDARNPLIMQWTILAVRNACENNASNQDVIRSTRKIGIIDNAALNETGLMLQEEEGGRSIGIAPLIRDREK